MLRNIAYEFQLSRMTSFEGDTGAYLQYAHVRLCSLERRVAPDLVLREDPGAINTDLLTEQHAHNIIMLLATYPDVVRFAARSFEPSTIITFCFLLSHTISTAWETLIVKNQETELAQARLLLYQSARQVLASAMRLLSFVPLERM
jgi:arginyl-tRNA synthetase